MAMMKVDRDFTPLYPSIFKGMTQDLSYRVHSEEFELKRTLSIVLDTSLSMGIYKQNGIKTRLDVLKDCARWLIRKFEGTGTKICLIPYSDQAEVMTELLDMKIAADVNLLIESVDQLNSFGNSNIGDGLRRAYRKLKNAPMDSIKTMIVLTDGEPNMYTTVTQHLYTDMDLLEGAPDYKTDDGNASFVYTDYQRAVAYGRELGEILAAEKYIKPYFIAITQGVPYKLQVIGEACKTEKLPDGRYYYTAGSVNSMEDIYQSMMDSIDKSLSITMMLNDTLPEGIQAISFPGGSITVQEDGRYHLSCTVDSIPIDKNETTGMYSLRPFSLPVTLRYDSPGTMEFNSLNVSVVDTYGNPTIPQLDENPIIKVYVDEVPPVTTCLLTGSEGSEKGNFRSDVIVTLSAIDPADGAGVLKTEYSFNNTEWIQYISPFTVSEEGRAKVYFRSIDIVGNMEDIKAVEFIIDKTPPVTTCVLEGEKGVDDWYISDVVVTLLTEDGSQGSGIALTAYSFDGSSFLEYLSAITVTTEGLTEIYFRSVDKAGNAEDTQKVELHIDKTGPLVSPPQNINMKASGDLIRIENIGEATAEDVSGVVSIANNAPELYQPGITSVIWAAVDLNSNTGIARQIVTIVSTEAGGAYTHGADYEGEADIKVWFKTNSIQLRDVTLVCILHDNEKRDFKMDEDDGTWQVVLHGMPKDRAIRYRFRYEQAEPGHEYTSWYNFSNGITENDYIKTLVNLSETEAKVCFKEKGFTSDKVEFFYKLDGAEKKVLMQKNNDKFEHCITGLSNGMALSYRFSYRRSDHEWESEWYEYCHTRQYL